MSLVPGTWYSSTVVQQCDYKIQQLCRVSARFEGESDSDSGERDSPTLSEQ